MAEQQSAIDRLVRETLGNQLATIISLQAQLEETGTLVEGLKEEIGNLKRVADEYAEAEKRE